MNLTNDSGENDQENNTSSDEDDDIENTYSNTPSILIEKFFTSNTTTDELDNNDDDDNDDNDDDGDDDDDARSDIENHYAPDNVLPRQNHLCNMLRQSNRLTELKLNLIRNHSSLRHAISDSDMSKANNQQRNNTSLSSVQYRRLYLPSSFISEIQTQITNWLQASTCLIDSISTSIYHRRCWSQLLLTYFIEEHFVDLQFLLCTQSLSLANIDHDHHSLHDHACIPEEDAYKLCSILQKGSRFSIDSNIFDHIRRIIIIKSMIEVFNDNTSLQQLYVKQLTSLKQSLTRQQSSVMNVNNNVTMSVASVYSKLLLFLSSLYSIRAETMQILFCQHLLNNPMYSYLVNS